MFCEFLQKSKTNIKKDLFKERSESDSIRKKRKFRAEEFLEVNELRLSEDLVKLNKDWGDKVVFDESRPVVTEGITIYVT